MDIRRATPDDPLVAALLRLHFQRAVAASPRGSAHALDLDGLRSPSIRLWAAWDGAALLGVGALKRLAADHGEVKSMHTAEAARRRGVGAALLRHVMATARADGMARLSLETGVQPYFAPARALYEKAGFAACPPFGEYRPDPNSLFMTLALG